MGQSPLCSTQAMYAKGRLITVQGHPEFNDRMMKFVIEARHKQGIFDDALYEDASKRAGNPHDGIAIAQAFLRFLLE